MWKRFRKETGDVDEKRMEASFTVEMSLLCGIMLPLLIAILISGFYISDQAVMQGLASEAAMMGANVSAYEDAGSRLSAIESGLNKRRMTWTKGMHVSASAGKDYAQAQVSGTVPVPGMIAMFLTGGKLQAGAACKVRILRPADLIRKVRGVKYLLDTLEE